jgi:hypothetical protein
MSIISLEFRFKVLKPFSFSKNRRSRILLAQRLKEFKDCKLVSFSKKIIVVNLVGA